MKRPQQLSGHGVPPANVTIEPETRRLLAVVAAGDDDVLVDRRWRDQRNPSVDVALDRRLEIDGTVLAKGRNRRARLRVDRDESIARAKKQPRCGPAGSWPEGD